MKAVEARKIAESSRDKMIKQLIEDTIPGQAGIGNTQTGASKLRPEDIKQLEDLGYVVEKLVHVENTWLVNW